MIGKDEKYDYLKCEPFEFVEDLRFNEQYYFNNERVFLEFLLRNEWMQRALGIRMQGSNGRFPDVKGFIYGSEVKIKVEVEFFAESYVVHKHPFGGVHLILAFMRSKNTRIIKGCPVWAFYEKSDEGIKFCLHDDMDYDFNSSDCSDFS